MRRPGLVQGAGPSWEVGFVWGRGLDGRVRPGHLRAGLFSGWRKRPAWSGTSRPQHHPARAALGPTWLPCWAPGPGSAQEVKGCMLCIPAGAGWDWPAGRSI